MLVTLKFIFHEIKNADYYNNNKIKNFNCSGFPKLKVEVIAAPLSVL